MSRVHSVGTGCALRQGYRTGPWALSARDGPSAAAAEAAAPLRLSDPVFRPRSVRGRPHRGETHLEGRAAAELALHGDAAAVVLSDVADDREAEAGAAGVSRTSAVDPVEALEDPREVAGGNADPGVRYLHPRLAGGRADAHANGATGVRRADRVVDEVPDEQGEIARGAAHALRRPDVELEREAGLLGR